MKTSRILKSMRIISWIIFIGICIKTGAILISFMVSLFINQDAGKDLYWGLDLSNLYEYSPGLYAVFVVLLLIVLTAQAFIFYLVIKLFSRFNEQDPFNQRVSELISKISYISLSAGFFALIGTGFGKWLENQNVAINFEWSAEVFLFMAGVLFIVGLFYKRGIEIQSENELTI